MTSPIIALSGYARSGKDTAAAVLLERGWTRVSFADKLRDFLLAVNPPIVHLGREYQLARLVDAYGWEHVKDSYEQVRPLLQRTGTDAGRAILGQNVWVDAIMGDLPAGPVVFTDCRFPNEAAAAREHGGIVVRIDRPGTGPAVASDGTVHVSETSLDDYEFDYRITNGGSLADLHGAALVAAAMARARAV